MPEFRSVSASLLLHRASILVSLVLLLPTSALAQYIGSAPPPPLPAAPRPGEVETPAAALARAVRTLAQSPRDFSALIRAGRAALDLGDTQAAIGFFGRAEEVRPSNPEPKIGMGAATVASGDASGALRWFFQAQQLGATAAAIGADRGLAQDLLGNQPAAQADYRAALAGPERDEARRRLALSLGISGDRTGAFTTLQPLLNRRDPAAQRIRAFVLALVGDERGASNAIDQAMPGTGGRMGGFFRLLPALSATQKAAAVHLGVFPDPGEIRIAAVSPRLLPPPPAEVRSAPLQSLPPSRNAVPEPAQPVIKREPQVAADGPVLRAATSTFEFNQAPPRKAAPITEEIPAPAAAPSVPPATATVSTPQPGFSPVPSVAKEPISEVPDEPLKFDPLTGTDKALAAITRPAPTTVTPEPSSIVPVSVDRLSGIDRLLAKADELPIPPAPQPKFEKPATIAALDTAKGKKPSDTKKAADSKAADAKKAADKKAADAKKAAEEIKAREATGLSGTHWVQLAGGAHADRMAIEYRRLAAKSPALKKKGGAVTAGKDYFRLLTGPFASKSEAQAFVNQLAKDGVDGFSWTRTPPAIKIEKLPPK